MARKISNEIIFLRGVLCKVLLSLSLRVARGASDARASVRFVWNYSLARFRQRTLEEEDALDPLFPSPFAPKRGKRWPPLYFRSLKGDSLFPYPPLSLSSRIPLLISPYPSRGGVGRTGDTRKFTLHGVSKVSPRSTANLCLPRRPVL